MKNSSKEICQFLAMGILHAFSSQNRKYLYISPVNRFFEIDEEAYSNFEKIRNGEELDNEINSTFFKEFEALRNSFQQSVAEPVFLRIYFSDKQDISDLARKVKDKVSGPTVIKQCEIIIRISDENFDNYQTVLSDIVFQFKELWNVYKIKTNIILKASYEFFTSERLDYLKSRRIIPVIQLSYSEYNNQYLDKYAQATSYYFEVVKNNLGINDIKSNYKNFVVLENEVTPDNYQKLASEFTGGFGNDESISVPETYQNILKVFKVLTSKVVPQSVIATSEIKSDVSTCSTCWAQRVCKLSAVYETFGSLPENVSANPLNCNLIQGLTENLIDLISKSQKILFERSLNKMEFALDAESSITLINP